MGDDLEVRNATLIAGPGEQPRPGSTIAIVGGRIAAKATPAARVVDVDGAVVTAGFWNSHVHLTERCWSRAGKAPAAGLQAALDDMFGARGFTSVVDLGSNPFDTRAVQRRIRSGELRGPRIRTAGLAIYPPHGLPFYIRDDVPRLFRLLIPQPRTIAGARRAAVRTLRDGGEVVKLFTGSWVRPGTVRPMSRAAAFAAVSAAHERGALVFAHPSDREGTAIALDAGVDVLAHVPSATEGTTRLLQQAAASGRWLTPTLDMLAQTVSREASYLDPIYAGLATFRNAGGRLLFGTDVGYLRDHDTSGELAALAHCGLGVDDVLSMLTTHPAAAFGTGTGTVTPGEPGDLVVLDRLDSVGDLAAVRTTIRAGRVIWSATPA